MFRQKNNGVVFNEDLSNLEDLPVNELAQEEIAARENWGKVRKKIREKCRKKNPSVETTAVLLEQRVLAPSLTMESASTRSKPAESGKGRCHPPCISLWKGFCENVKNFEQEDKTIEFEIPPFTLCSANGDPAMQFCDENQEHAF